MNASVMKVGEPRARRSPVPAAVGGYLGDLVAWRFGKFAQPRREVVNLFGNHGFQVAFETDLSEPGKALAEAFRSGIVYGRTLDARPLDRPNKDTPYAVAVYKKIPVQGESGDQYPCGARVRINSEGKAVALEPEGGVADPECLACAEKIAERANLLVNQVESQELSHALVAAGRSVSWAKFRESGGVYWVPSYAAPRLRGLFDALEKLGGFAPTVQPLFGDDAGRTMRNCGLAAASAIEEEIEGLRKELELAKLGKLGKKGVENRIANCRAVLIQATSYREVLSGELAGITKVLGGIDAEFRKTIGNLDARDAAFDMPEGT